MEKLWHQLFKEIGELDKIKKSLTINTQFVQYLFPEVSFTLFACTRIKSKC